MRKELSLTFVLLVIEIAFLTCASITSVGLGLAPSASNMSGESLTATYVHPFDGYTLFAPMRSTITYLIDNSGQVIHTWESDYRPALSVYLLENGSILRTAFPGLPSNSTFTAGGGTGGLVQKIDWNGTVVWEFKYSNNQHLLHHDIEALPNGNVLMIAWEHKTGEEAIAAGRDPSLLTDGELWPDHIIEVEPTGATGGDIVWEWHAWDHLIQDYNSTAENYGVVAAHPELIDINVYGRPGADWNHINSIDYNEEFDQILLSVNAFREIWVIDHSTTTEEAANHTGGNSGKGGAILYRWGNPQTYRAGDADDQKFFHQHDAQWVESGFSGAGNILVFNNGQNRLDGSYSSVDEIVPPVDSNGSYSITYGSAYGPEEQTWIYTAEPPTSLYSSGISGAQRLPNGNTLVCDGQGGRFFEVTTEKEVVWEYVNVFPNGGMNNVFKVCRYGRDFSGLLDLIRPNDVAITNVDVDKTTVLQGQEVIIEATVENQGVFTETFNVTAYANATEIGRELVNDLEQGASQVLSFAWDTGSFTGGNYTINVAADVVANETDTLDNTFTYGVNIRVLSHDVAVVNVTLFKTIIGQGYSTFANVTVRNQGDYTETFDVTLNVTTMIIDTFTNITLASRNSMSVNFVWNATGYEKGNYTLYAYASLVDGEIDLEDNMFTVWVLVTIPGDINGDSEVNIFDIVTIAGAYNAEQGEPHYIANCDIDGDGDIDIFDIVAAAGNYGESWEP
ncbi:aryl-sulfate sulfotransferase [Candidatus Bathyarchaeota archaeon]|nr:aryl-sulfate sulfotransferase [Candidatus Bathyarchaeota archaeon]